MNVLPSGDVSENVWLKEKQRDPNQARRLDILGKFSAIFVQGTQTLWLLVFFPIHQILFEKRVYLNSFPASSDLLLLCRGFMAQSTQWSHAECGQFT